LVKVTFPIRGVFPKRIKINLKVFWVKENRGIMTERQIHIPTISKVDGVWVLEIVVQQKTNGMARASGQNILRGGTKILISAGLYKKSIKLLEKKMMDWFISGTPLQEMRGARNNNKANYPTPISLYI